VRYTTLVTLLFAPSLAWGQAPQEPMSPQIQALQQTVIKLTGEALDWQTRAIELQRQVDDLTRQLTEAKKTAVKSTGQSPHVTTEQK
jgi:hypothetical protein